MDLKELGLFLGGIISAGVPAACAVIALLYNQRRQTRELEAKIASTNRTERRAGRAEAVNQWREIAGQQQGQINRLEVQLGRLQGVVARLFAAVAECRESEAVIYGHLELVYNAWGRNAQILKGLGQEVEELSPLPERPKRVSLREEFEIRTATQDSALLQEISDAIRNPDEPPDDEPAGNR